MVSGRLTDGQWKTDGGGQWKTDGDGQWCVHDCRQSSSLLRLVELMLMDAMHILKIVCELNVVPLALQITTICGNSMVQGLAAGIQSSAIRLSSFECMLLVLSFSLVYFK